MRELVLLTVHGTSSVSSLLFSDIQGVDKVMEIIRILGIEFVLVTVKEL
jgi:hypothetical protein